MRWQVKWLKGAAFGMLPFAAAFRRAKRRLKPYPHAVPGWTLEEGLRQLCMLRGSGCELAGAAVLEVGCGWQPTIPLLYSLAGAARVVLVDTQRLMDGPTFAGVATNLAAHAPLIAGKLGRDEAAVRAALRPASDRLDELLPQFRMEYVAPCDLIASGLPDGGFDIVSSRAVLEHVPPAVLRPLLGRMFRLLKPGGWSCHAVDNSDHWSHNDPRLSRVNFLRHSDAVFGFLNRFNALDYQNRLRHPEYAALLAGLGYEVVRAESVPEPQALEDLKTLPVAPRFRAHADEDLAKLDSYFVARRPAG